MAENNDFAMGYAMGQDSNSNGGDGFGFGGGWGGLIGLLIVASLFGGGWGFGGGFGGGGGALNGVLTRADLSSGFSFNSLENVVRGIQQGICDSTYALNNGIMSGFHGVDNALCGIGHQISDCCCTTQNAIQNVRYDLATQACDTRNLIQNVARDITDNANANTRSIMDFLVNDKISTLTAENQALKFQASQANQNNYIAATIDAGVAEVLRRTGHSCPTAAFLVQPPTPINFPTNGCGTVQWGGNGYGGCGCGCAA